MTAEIFVLPYDGVSPRFAAPPVHAGPGAAVLGRVTLGRGAWLGAASVVRGDGNYVEIGDDFRLGSRGTVHIAHELYPTRIGHGVTAGATAVIHACDVGDGCHIGRDAVILDGSTVGAGAALADGALAFPRSQLDGGWLYAGRPAKPVRQLGPGELEALHAAGRAEPDAAGWPAAAADAAPMFLAATARLNGRIVCAEGVGIWFGCDFDAGAGTIVIGANTNVQDNSVIRGAVRIGRESTIGHNVALTDATVGDHSLVGIGAVLAPGTVVEDDVLVAAGARSEPGQILGTGGLWGGAPAREIAPLDARRREIITGTWPRYCDYGARYAAVQRGH